MKDIKKSWFTLVELIVVITILAILGTIAFISLQWYTSDARNAKRTDDIGSIESAMNNLMAGGQNITSFVMPKTENQLSNPLIGWTATTVWSGYDAWTPNFASLWINAAEFKDPKGADYVIWITTKRGWKYQIAATMENWSGPLFAKLKWNYFARWIDTVTTLSWSDSKTLMINEPQKINFFDIGDNTTAWDIVNIKTWSNLIFAAIPTSLSVRLLEAETEWLIKSIEWTAGYVSDNWNDVAYTYK